MWARWNCLKAPVNALFSVLRENILTVQLCLIEGVRNMWMRTGTCNPIVSYASRLKKKKKEDDTDPQIPAWMCSFNSLCRL